MAKRVIKESIKLFTFTAETPLPAGRQGDRREGLVFDLVVRSPNQKSSAFNPYLWPGPSGESASHRFSRETILSQRPLCLERVTSSCDEWAVKVKLYFIRRPFYDNLFVALS